jgi:hypothetical protein
MPKKTRKEKILAQQRRLSISSPSRLTLPDKPTPHIHTVELPKTLNKKAVQTILDRSGELLIIQKDLYKTVLFALCAFGVELYLYWLLR